MDSSRQRFRGKRNRRKFRTPLCPVFLPPPPPLWKPGEEGEEGRLGILYASSVLPRSWPLGDSRTGSYPRSYGPPPSVDLQVDCLDRPSSLLFPDVKFPVFFQRCCEMSSTPAVRRGTLICLGPGQCLVGQPNHLLGPSWTTLTAAQFCNET
jgi:hypothetical protein